MLPDIVSTGPMFGDMHSLGNIQPPPLPNLAQSAWMEEPAFMNPHRELLGTGVELDAVEGTCQLRTSLDTLYVGTANAQGMMFAVTALEDIEILAFEFASFGATNPIEVEIYTRQGTDILDADFRKQQGWVQISAAMAQPSPDGLGSISPRAEMLRSLQMLTGEQRSIYISLNSQNLQVEEGAGTTGDRMLDDGRLQLDVGGSLRSGPFPSTIDKNRGFQGRIHYRTIEPCVNFNTETDVVFQFAINSTAEIIDANKAFSDGFVQIIDEEPALTRFKEAHGLSLTRAQGQDKGREPDCTEYGFAEGCKFYDGTLTLFHYRTLTSREVTLEVMEALNKRGGIAVEGNAFSMVYIGDQVLRQTYDIIITGVPDGTLFNPLQRRYVEQVTFDFITSFATDVETYRVEVTGQRIARRRRNLRALQSVSTGIVRLEAAIYGVGDDPAEFFTEVEEAFQRGSEKYREQIKSEQFRPSQINDKQDFGEVFANIFQVSVARNTANGTFADSGGTAASERDMSTFIQIIVWSSILFLSVAFLVYRCAMDFCCVRDENKIRRKQKLSDRQKEEDDEKAEREQRLKELERMDEPVRNPNKLKASSFSGIDAFMKSKTPDPDNKPQKKEPTRGVGKSNTFSGLDAFMASKTTKDASDNKSRAEPTRGVKKSNTFSGVEGFFGSKPASQTMTSATKGREEPAKRGVGKSSSFGGVDSFFKSAQTTGGTAEKKEPTRGVKKSNTFSGWEGFAKSAAAAAADDKGKKEPERGTKKSSSFTGLDSFFQSQADTAPKKAKGAKSVATAPEPTRGVRRHTSREDMAATRSTGGADIGERRRKKKSSSKPGGSSPKQKVKKTKSGDLPSSSGGGIKKKKKSKSSAGGSKAPTRVDMTERKEGAPKKKKRTKPKTAT